MDVLGVLHLGAAVGSLVSGGGVIMSRKGTRAHRRLGWTYVASMATLNVTALLIYDLFGGFGPFHVAAIISGTTIVAGVAATRWKAKGKAWLARHAYWMVWSYIGLVAAAVSETATRYLSLDFGTTVAVATLTVVLVGWLLTRTKLPPLLARFGFSPPPPPPPAGPSGVEA